MGILNVMTGIIGGLGYEYNEKNDIHTFNVNLGDEFLYNIKKIMSESRVSKIFISITNSKIVVYSFFLFELKQIVLYMLANKSKYGINIPNLHKLKDKIDQILDSAKESEYKLNYEKIKLLFRYEISSDQRVAFTRYETIKSHMALRGMLLDADTGTGKTFMSLALAEAVDADVIIVITMKATVNEVWLNAIADAADGGTSKEKVYIGKHEVYCPLKDINRPRVSRTYTGQRHIVVSYESMESIRDDIPGFGNGYFSRHNKKVAVIVDEWHNFADQESKRSQSLVALLNDIGSNDNILMSGTPIKARATEVGLMFKILDKRYNKVVENRFLATYKNPGGYLTALLPARYAEFSAKVSKSGLNLNPVTTNYFKVTLPNELGMEFTLTAISKKMAEYIKERETFYDANRKEYIATYEKLYKEIQRLASHDIKPHEFTEYEKDFKLVKKYYDEKILQYYPDLSKRVTAFERRLANYLKDKDDRQAFNDAKSIIKYVMLKIRGEALANVVMKERIRCHAEMAKYVEYNNIVDSTAKKTLCFGGYIEICDNAYNALVGNGYTPVRVYGEHLKYFTHNISALKNDPKVNPGIATYKALGTGVPVTEANVVIIFDMPFRMYMYDQAIARVWRRGQDEDVYVYIASLDTGDVPNLNSRNIDIISFFAKEVENITGYKMSLSLDGNDIDIGQEGYVEYMHDKVRQFSSFLAGVPTSNDTAARAVLELI